MAPTGWQVFAGFTVRAFLGRISLWVCLSNMGILLLYEHGFCFRFQIMH